MLDWSAVINRNRVHVYLLIVCRALTYGSKVCLGIFAARLVASAVFSETA